MHSAKSFFAASSVPTPLYLVYQARWHFSASTLTLIFAVYAAALLLTLLTVGALSDFLGRRRVLAAALVVELLSMVAFIGADGVGWLLAARAVQGVATGAAAGALSAAVADLAPPERPTGANEDERDDAILKKCPRGARRAGHKKNTLHTLRVRSV